MYTSECVDKPVPASFAVLPKQTKEMRVIRRQPAEEKAKKVTVKVVFPVLLCIFPVIFVVTLGPAAIRLNNLFSTR